MPNINGALGCAQMERLPDFILSKRKLYELYKNVFYNSKIGKIMHEPHGCSSNYWLQTFLLCQDKLLLRDEILETSNENFIGCRPVWSLLNKQKPYKNTQHSPLIVAEILEKKIINLPSSYGLA